MKKFLRLIFSKLGIAALPRWLESLLEILKEIACSFRMPSLPEEQQEGPGRPEGRSPEFMKQGIQSKARNPALRQSGCYFFSILAQAALQQGLVIDSEQAEALFHEAVRLGHVEPNCFVQNPVALANLAAKRNAYRSISRERPPAVSVYIQRLEKPMFAHFILMHDGQAWDPLDPGRPGAKGYEPCSYRVIT